MRFSFLNIFNLDSSHFNNDDSTNKQYFRFSQNNENGWRYFWSHPSGYASEKKKNATFVEKFWLARSASKDIWRIFVSLIIRIMAIRILYLSKVKAIPNGKTPFYKDISRSRNCYIELVFSSIFIIEDQIFILFFFFQDMEWTLQRTLDNFCHKL